MNQFTDSQKRDSLYTSLKLKRKTTKAIAFLTALTLMFSSLLPLPAWADYGDKLPLPQPPFKGKIGLTYKESQPDFPKPIKAPQKAPNVLLVLLDDVGLCKLLDITMDVNEFHITAEALKMYYAVNPSNDVAKKLLAFYMEGKKPL